MLYRQREQWKGVKLEGVSVCGGHSRTVTEQRNHVNRRYLHQGEREEKSWKLIVPEDAIPEKLLVEIGDLVVIGDGPEKLESASQPARSGWNYMIVKAVEDRRWDKILPHIAVTGC